MKKDLIERIDEVVSSLMQIRQEIDYEKRIIDAAIETTEENDFKNEFIRNRYVDIALIGARLINDKERMDNAIEKLSEIVERNKKFNEEEN